MFRPLGAATSTRAWTGLASLMFHLLREPHRRGHGQAGVAYVPAVAVPAFRGNDGHGANVGRSDTAGNGTDGVLWTAIQKLGGQPVRLNEHNLRRGGRRANQDLSNYGYEGVIWRLSRVGRWLTAIVHEKASGCIAHWA